MSLTAREKADVVMYLGYPGKTIIQESTNYNSLVADRLLNLSSEIEDQVRKWLCRLSEIDERLDRASCRLAAKKVDEIELNPDEIRLLRSERRRLIGRLGDLLDIDPMDGCGGGANISVCV